MTALCPPEFVDAPLTTAPRFGLYSVATVLDNQARAACGVFYLPEAIAPSGFVYQAQCGSSNALAHLGDEPDEVIGDGFWVVTGVTCLYDDIEARAAQRMALDEQALVERELWTGALGTKPEFDAAGTQKLSATPVSLAVGVGLLEAYLGDTYNGQGVIHSSRLVAPAAGRDLIVSQSGGRMSTLLGTPWAFGQGYSVNTGPGGAAASAGTAWLYATGQVVVRRGDLFKSTVEQALNRSTNNIELVVQRPVTVTVDGILAAVQVELDNA